MLSVDASVLPTNVNVSRAPPMEGLRFLWLELTNLCNLHCAHCYAESGPRPSGADLLTTADFARLLDEAAEVGCRAVQFIGGEATLHPGLPQLIAHARAVGFDHVEVYTNATHLPPGLLECFVKHKVSVAVSIYADDAAVHDAVTQRRGSHRRTIANVKKLIDAGLDVRVGVTAMDANADRIEPTVAFVRNLGVRHVGVDHARGIGRGIEVTHGELGLQALCGSCWKGSLCIAPDGVVSTCIMSKSWPVGTVLDSGLAELIEALPLRSVRQMIRDTVWMPRQAAGDALTACDPDGCPPTLICPPSDPCSPDIKCQPCLPSGIGLDEPFYHESQRGI
jgi:organic radical activating enzyme